MKPSSANPSSTSTKPMTMMDNKNPSSKPGSQDSSMNSMYKDQDEWFSWMDVHPQAFTCAAEGGPADGKTCKFPFKYRGKTYFSCAPLEGDMKYLIQEAGAGMGWCSIRRDLNGIHMRGPYPDPMRYVGFCSEQCKMKSM